jgi:DNA integrity scanning protein DisA with diadenylate cyclase activity
MADIHDYIAANDRMRIHLHEAWQVAYWTRVLDVTEEDLRRLVKEVGNETHLVRARLTELREAGESREAA